MYVYIYIYIYIYSSGPGVGAVVGVPGWGSACAFWVLLELWDLYSCIDIFLHVSIIFLPLRDFEVPELCPEIIKFPQFYTLLKEVHDLRGSLDQT